MSAARNNISQEQLSAVGRLMIGERSWIESRVKGSSMGNTLPDGCLVRIDSTRAPARGDIVAFVVGTALCTHRVVARSSRIAGDGSEYLVTRGDDWLLCDPPIIASQVIG